MNHALVSSLGWTLFHFVWEGAGIAALLGLALLALKKKSANARYAASCVALAAMAVCPVATFLAVQSSSSTALTPQDIAAITVYSKSIRIVPESASPLSSVLKSVEPLLPNMVLVWVIGMGFLTLRMIGGLLEVERLKRRDSKPASAEWQARLNEIAGSLGIRRAVQLLESSRITVPSALGLLKATVMVPCSALTGLPIDELEALFAHELAHIRRHDYLVNLLQTLVETTLFYHPAVWWASHVIRVEREHCCDDIAVRAMGDPVVYARALTSIEERRALRPHLSLAANGGSLMQRIRRILGLSTAPNKLALTWVPCIAIVALLLPLSSFVQGSQKEKAQKDDGPEISIESQKVPEIRQSMKRAFKDLLSNPDNVIDIDGKRKKVKDLTPQERKKIETKLDEAADAAENAMKMANEVTRKTLKEVFAKDGAVQKSIEEAMKSVKSIDIPMNIDLGDMDAQMQSDLQDAKKDAEDSARSSADMEKVRKEALEQMERGMKDHGAMRVEIQKAMAEARKAMEQAQVEMQKSMEESRKQGKTGDFQMQIPVDVSKILESVSKQLEGMNFDIPPMHFDEKMFSDGGHMTDEQRAELRKSLSKMRDERRQMMKAQREQIRKQIEELKKQLKEMDQKGDEDDSEAILPRSPIAMINPLPGPFDPLAMEKIFLMQTPEPQSAPTPGFAVPGASSTPIATPAPAAVPALTPSAPSAAATVNHKSTWSLLSFIPYPLNKWNPL